MTRRIAVNRTIGAVISDRPTVLVIDGETVTGTYPLEHEQAATIWLGGTAVLKRHDGETRAYDLHGDMIKETDI